jgi:hypothetical protein
VWHPVAVITPHTDWRKSSFCGSSACVEVATTSDGGVLVRDSKHPGGAVLEFTESEWVAFTAAVRAGEFDQG